MSNRQYGRQRGRQLSRLCHLLSVWSGFLGVYPGFKTEGHPSRWGCAEDTRSTQSTQENTSRWQELSDCDSPAPSWKPEAVGADFTPPLPILWEPQSVLLLTSHTIIKDTHHTCPPTRPCSSTGLYPRSVLTCRRATTTPKQHPSLHGSHLSSLYVVLKPTPGNKCESTLKIPESSIPGWETASSQHTPITISGCLYKL